MPGSERSGAGSRSSHSGSSSFSSQSLVGKLAKYELKRKFYEKLDDFRQRVLLYKEPGFMVYRAKCAYSGGVVVLKGYARETLTLETRQRIWSEVNIIQSAQCPFILKCFDSFEDHGWWWLVLENCAAGDLYHIMQLYGRINSEGWLVSQVLLPLLQTLGYLHNEGIIHRDLKPEHVLFNSEKVAKLSGFFLAQDVTKFGYPKDMVGVLDYIAPEVLKLKSPQHIALAKAGLAPSSYDFKVDVWSLGVLTYDVLVGEPPFASDDASDTVQRVLQEDPVFPEDMTDLAADFILCCLTKDPLARPTARQLLSHPWIKANIVWVPPLDFEDPVPDMDYSYYEPDDNMGGVGGLHAVEEQGVGKAVVWWNPVTWFQSKEPEPEQDQDLAGTQQAVEQAVVLQALKRQASAASLAMLGFVNKLLPKSSNQVSQQGELQLDSIGVPGKHHDADAAPDSCLHTPASRQRPVSAAAKSARSRNQVVPGGMPRLSVASAATNGEADVVVTPRSELAGDVSDDSEAAAPVMQRIQETVKQQQSGIVPPISIASIIRPTVPSQPQQSDASSRRTPQQGAATEAHGRVVLGQGQSQPVSVGSNNVTPRSGRLEPLASHLVPSPPPATGIATLPILPAISPRSAADDSQQQQQQQQQQGGAEGVTTSGIAQQAACAPLSPSGDHVLQLSARGTPPAHSQSAALPHTSHENFAMPTPPKSMPSPTAASPSQPGGPNLILVPHPPAGAPPQLPQASIPQLSYPMPPQQPQFNTAPHRPLTAGANLSHAGTVQGVLGTCASPQPIKGPAVLRPDVDSTGWDKTAACLTSTIESLKPPCIVLKAATHSRAGTPAPDGGAAVAGQMQALAEQAAAHASTEVAEQGTVMQQALQLMQEASRHD